MHPTDPKHHPGEHTPNCCWEEGRGREEPLGACLGFARRQVYGGGVKRQGSQAAPPSAVCLWTSPSRRLHCSQHGDLAFPRVRTNPSVLGGAWHSSIRNTQN